MIDAKTLNRCIDILSELNAHLTTKRDKELTLELGYIIKQEYDLVKEWDLSINERPRFHNTQAIDVSKLLEDNVQLYKENETLLKDLNKLKQIIESKLPYIQQDLAAINDKFDTLNNSIKTNLC